MYRADFSFTQSFAAESAARRSEDAIALHICIAPFTPHPSAIPCADAPVSTPRRSRFPLISERNHSEILVLHAGHSRAQGLPAGRARFAWPEGRATVSLPRPSSRRARRSQYGIGPHGYESDGEVLYQGHCLGSAACLGSWRRVSDAGGQRSARARCFARGGRESLPSNCQLPVPLSRIPYTLRAQ